MFGTFRARASTLSLSRLPLRVHSAARQNAHPVERVRFLRPEPRSKSIIATVLTYATFYAVFTAIVFSPLDKLDIDLEKEETDEQGGSIFIPFPGTIKEVQPPPYRGSDPEWQEYVKFSKDPAVGKRIRDELATLIQQTVEKHPILTMRCGKDIKLRRYWLDVDFPPTPPPEFERSGIEVTDDSITWTSMPVDSLTVSRIRQALWPSALTLSLWSFSKVLFWNDTFTTGGIFGIHTKPQASVDSILSQSMKPLSGRPSKPKQPAEENVSSPTSNASRALEEPPRTDPNHAPDKSVAEQIEELNKKLIAIRAETKRIEELHKVNHPWKAHLGEACTAFQRKFAQTWRAAPSYPPRGSILVSGLIELDSSRAWLVVDVKAAWDPKTRQYDKRSMRVAMRRVQMKRQAPISR